jgi:CheY-like chemotaxis protein
MDREAVFIMTSCEAMMPEAKKVLVVDDDEKIGNLICHFLGKCSFEVRTVGDGLDAIELLKNEKGHFDIIITDYSMPQMNGLELTRVVRQRYPRTVIIGMSGFDSVGNDFMQAGAFAFFRKPFHLPDILYTINSVLPQLQ